MITPQACRAARGFLDWSQQQLANSSNVGVSTVKNFEVGRTTPVTNNLLAIQRALEEAGIDFIADDNCNMGVRLRRPELRFNNTQFPTKRSVASNFSASAVYHSRKFTVRMPVGLLQKIARHAPEDPFDRTRLANAFEDAQPRIALSAEIAIKAGRVDAENNVILDASDFPEL